MAEAQSEAAGVDVDQVKGKGKMKQKEKSTQVKESGEALDTVLLSFILEFGCYYVVG